MTITSTTDSSLTELCKSLREMSADLEKPGAWPAEQLALCGDYGVFQWFVDTAYGGQAWSGADIIRGYLALSSACLTTTFVITQRMGACRRIAINETDEAIKHELLPDLVSGKTFATVGISHLTTSRRHLKEPVLRAQPVADGFVLDGFSPWVTGAAHAQTIVIGATLEDGRQVLLAMPTDLPGVSVPPPAELIGVNASATGPVKLDRVHVDEKWLLAGPEENIMQKGVGATSGGLQTSTLAIGLADAAIEFVEAESEKRPELSQPATVMRADWKGLRDDLLAMADGHPICSNEELRTRANSLVLRTSQAALAAAKGTGYIVGHPAGRWCREALFFLVWSCPQPVMAANMCEFAGILA